MWQLGGEGGLGESGYMHMYGWVPSLFTRNYHIVNLLLGVCVLSNSIMSDSCHLTDIMEPSRLLCLWDSTGKDAGEGRHFLLQGIFPTGIKLAYPALQADSVPLEKEEDWCVYYLDAAEDAHPLNRSAYSLLGDLFPIPSVSLWREIPAVTAFGLSCHFLLLPTAKGGPG